MEKIKWGGLDGIRKVGNGGESEWIGRAEGRGGCERGKQATGNLIGL